MGGGASASPHPQAEAQALDLAEKAIALRSVGCLQYTVGASSDDEVTIWTCEVWGTKEQHDASLQLAETKEAITRAMPLIAGDFTRSETEVRGGLGL